MTTLSQTLNHLYIDRESAEISIQNNDQTEIQVDISRTAQPFSELKNGKFRRLFNRHRIIR